MGRALYATIGLMVLCLYHFSTMLSRPEGGGEVAQPGKPGLKKPVSASTSVPVVSTPFPTMAKPATPPPAPANVANTKAPPTISPKYSGSDIKIIAAVSYCTTPELTSGRSAQEVIDKLNNGGFKRRHGSGVVSSAKDMTDSVAASCDGPPPCTFTVVGHDFLSCGNQIHVEYYCAGSINHIKKVVGTGSRMDIKCDTPIPLEEDNALEQYGVRQVSYEVEGARVDVWPISFSLPGSAFRSSISWKDKAFAPLIPANPSTYKFRANVGGKEVPTEVSYFSSYRTSYYAVTRKKMGWDCLRHYEILSQGTVPYFPDIQNMPYSTMAFFPRDLIYEAMTLPGVKFENTQGSFLHSDSFSIDFNVFNKTRYHELASQIQRYARRYLTSDFTANFILDSMVLSAKAARSELRRPRKILFIHHCYNSDYLGDTVWTGFGELEVHGGIDLIVDVVPPAEMSMGGAGGYWAGLAKHGDCDGGRKRTLRTSEKTLDKGLFYSYAGGWGSHRTQNNPLETITPDDVPQKIKERYFDAVIYGTAVKTLAWLDLVNEHYSKHEVAFLFGGDLPHNFNDFKTTIGRGQIFQREIYERPGVLNKGVYFHSPGIAETQWISCCQMQDAQSKVEYTHEDSPRDAKFADCPDPCECTTTISYGNLQKNRHVLLKVPEGTKMNCSSLPQINPNLENTCQCLAS